MAALPAGGDRLRPHAVAELHDGHEAVAARPVPPLGSGVRARRERGQRAPPGGRERHWNARPRVAERLNDLAGETLEAIDIAPSSLPASESARERVDARGQRL